MQSDLLKTALLLPESDRILLATQLMDSVEGSPPGLSLDDPDFEAELERRFNDGAPGVPWDVVRQQLADDLNS